MRWYNLSIWQLLFMQRIQFPFENHIDLLPQFNWGPDNIRVQSPVSMSLRPLLLTKRGKNWLNLSNQTIYIAFDKPNSVELEAVVEPSICYSYSGGIDFYLEDVDIKVHSIGPRAPSSGSYIDRHFLKLLFHHQKRALIRDMKRNRGRRLPHGLIDLGAGWKKFTVS